MTERIRAEAQQLGFTSIGFARATRLDREADRLEAWLGKGYHGEMGYMANHFEERVDPRRLVEGAKTVISLAFNYHNPDRPTDPDPNTPRIATYAYGEDYHHVLKAKLRTLLAFIRAEAPAPDEVEGRCFVDSAPLLERDWAARAGLGWNGKNTLLIHPRRGSYYFLAELVLNLEVDTYDSPLRDHCGTCTRCIDACPTQAISPTGYVLDATRCISYLTIELRDALPTEFAGKMEHWAFGCDICQDVCPWNRFAHRHTEPALEPHPDLLDLTARDWDDLTDEVFRRVFRRSAVRRTKFVGLKRNLDFLKK